MFSQLSMTTTTTTLVLIYSLRMFGMSMVMMPIMTNGLNELPSRMNPHGTALNNTLSQVSGAIGSAVMITIMSQRTAAHGEELAQEAMKNRSNTTTKAIPRSDCHHAGKMGNANNA